MTMDDPQPQIRDASHAVAREIGVHGSRWETIHDGYFSDVQVARAYVETIIREMGEHRPATVADLGGGTGFILRQLAGVPACAGARLVNVDLSNRQLAQCDHPRISRVNLCTSKVTRGDLGVGEDRLMFIMRSVLHYAGSGGSRLLLRHLRSQVKPGEMFVHQSASFANARDAGCLNLLYRSMRSDKWYPTVEELVTMLAAEGWAVRQTTPAPALPLDSRELTDRYAQTAPDIAAIRAQLRDQFGATPGVFVPREDGFVAYLHYHIFTCQAA